MFIASGLLSIIMDDHALGVYPTAEMRWFYRGELPGAVLRWYLESSGIITEPEQRTDKYLLLPDVSSVGIKLREGSLEIKARSQGLGLLQLEPGISGRLEKWKKWSLVLNDDVSAEDELVQAIGRWVAVYKSRYLARFDLQSESAIQALAKDKPAPAGCEFELTTIVIENQRWWTIAFESFGYEDTLVQNLLRLSSELLAMVPPAPMTAEVSCSYPRWLAGFAL